LTKTVYGAGFMIKNGIKDFIKRYGDTLPVLRDIAPSLYFLLYKRAVEQVEIDESINMYVPGYKANDKKYRHRLHKDITFACFMYGIVPNEYFMFHFETLSAHGRRTFVTEKSRMAYFNEINDQNDSEIFNDKNKTYLTFKKYYKRDVIKISCEDDFSIFEGFVRVHPVFIKKPLRLSCGKGVELFDSSNFMSIRDLFSEIVKLYGECQLEERITQLDEMANLHPSSVNTARIVTFVLKDKVYIHRPFLRMGKNNSIVDSGGRGGIIALIDADTGIVCTPGTDEGCNEYIVHPDTKIPIVGFKIPKWEEAVKLAKEIALVVPTVRCVGWDLALTDNGWIVVEGNSRTQFIGQQMTDRRGKREEFEELIKKIR